MVLSTDGTHARQDSMEVKCQLDEQCHCEILKPLERRRKREQRCLAHSLVGTPNYIAPEVLLRSGTYFQSYMFTQMNVSQVYCGIFQSPCLIIYNNNIYIYFYFYFYNNNNLNDNNNNNNNNDEYSEYPISE